MTSPDARPDRQSGAEALTDEPRRKGGLWWLLGLLALALLAAAIFLLVRNAGDDGDDSGVDVTNDDGGSNSDGDVGSETTTTTTAANSTTSDATTTTTSTDPTDPTTTTTSADPTTTTTVPGASTTAPGGGSGSALSAGGQPLVPAPASGLGALVGDQATGNATVESVVADEGFWVGAGPGDRVFVFLTPEARSSSGESPFQVEAGQSIELDGTVTAVPSDVAELGVTDDEGATELTDLGGYIEAQRVALAE